MSNWKKLLLNYFLIIVNEDKNIEKNRKNLCENENFVPIQLFKKIDFNRKNKIILNDFKKYFFENEIKYDEKFLRKFIHVFDKNEKFSINFNEFLALILPKETNEILNILKREEKKEISNEKFFLNILQQELNLIKILNEISNQILNSKNFIVFEAFNEIAQNEKFINFSNLKNYFEKNQIILNEIQIETIIFRLDSNNNKKISYQEFLEIFFPSKENNSNNNSEQSNFSYNLTTNNNQSLKNSKIFYDNFNLYFPKSEKLTNNLILSQNNSILNNNNNNKFFSLTSPRKEEFQSFFNKNIITNYSNNTNYINNNNNNYSNGNNVLQTSISNLIKSPTFSPNRSQIKNE